MNVWIRTVMLAALLFAAGAVHGQTFSFVPAEIALSDTPGAEIVFDASCTNLTQTPQTLMFVRSVNLLPGLWESSMCMDVCYPSTVDTFVTTGEYGSSPLQPGEVRAFSLHVYALGSTGTGYVRILVLNTRAPEDSIGVLFTATALPTDVGGDAEPVRSFHLGQNYPNPFNGSTTIRYRVERTGHGSQGTRDGGMVTLKVYDLLGREVAVLVNEPQLPGEYTVQFEAGGIPSGVYFCRLESGRQYETRRLIVLR
jgi:hypothetical protein